MMISIMKNMKVSFASIMLSSITGTLTLLIVIPLSNVAVSGVVLKSTPPVSQTLFTQHIIIHITLLPSADTGDCSDGVTVTLNGLTDAPPTNSRVTKMNPIASDTVNLLLVNLYWMSTLACSTLTKMTYSVISLTNCINNDSSCTAGASNDGTCSFILIVSSPSTMSSSTYHCYSHCSVSGSSRNYHIERSVDIITYIISRVNNILSIV